MKHIDGEHHKKPSRYREISHDVQNFYPSHGAKKISMKQYDIYHLEIFTPQESNMDTNKLPCFKGVTFPKAHHFGYPC